MKSLSVPMRSAIALSLIIATGLMFASSCKTSDYAAAEGVVTLNGIPLSDATVVFQSPNMPLATARTDDKGRYRLETGSIEGIKPGEYIVTVAAYATKKNGDDRAPNLAIPSRYVQPGSSGLTATIISGANRNIDFDLKTN